MKNRMQALVSVFLLSTVPLFAGDLGDVNNDMSISIVDALLTAQYYVGMNVQIDLRAADVNYSESVDIVDALVIAQ